MPGVLTRKLYSEVPGVVYTVRKSGPPKAMFRGTSGPLMIPRCVPSGSKTQIPPDPVQKILPRRSTFIPSGTPFSADAILANTRLLLRVPSTATSNALILRCTQISPFSSSSKHTWLSRLIATYRTDSSGEKAKPFGYSHSLVATEIWPSGAIRKTPAKSYSRWASGNRNSKENGGNSICYRCKNFFKRTS